MKKNQLIFLLILVFFSSCKKEEVIIALPTTPTNLTAVITSSRSALLSWKDNSTNEDGFNIERKINGGIYALVGTAGSNASTYSDATLTPNTSYTYRIYAFNKGGNSTTYSNEAVATTYDLPSLSTTAITSITALTAISGGNNLIINGSSTISEGICWSINQGPTIKDSTAPGIHTTLSNAFTSNLRNLKPGVKYYVRAYAVNSAGISYGDEKNFTTYTQSLPNITTLSSISGLYYYSAWSGGTVIDDGYSNVIERGVVFGLNLNPTVTLLTKTIDGNGIGAFNSFMGSLVPNFTYHVRAYATNSIGTAYGNDVVFTTKALVSPIMASGTIYYITAISASFVDCSVSDDGGVPLIVRGACWSTKPNPTISDSKTLDGIGLTYYTSLITGLTPNTTYYARAYATNSIGTSYGVEKSFTTNLH